MRSPTSSIIISLAALPMLGGCGLPSTQSTALHAQHQRISKKPRPNPPSTVPLRQWPPAYFPPLVGAVFHTLKSLTKLPMIGPVSPPGNAVYATVHTIPHGYAVTWYDSLASSAFHGTFVKVSSQIPSGIPMAALIGTYSYRRYTSSHQAANRLSSYNRRNTLSSHPHTVSLPSGIHGHMFVTQGSSVLVWNQYGWRYRASDEVSPSPTTVTQMADRVISTMTRLHSFPPYTQAGIVSSAMLPTLAPVTMTWADGPQVFSVALNQGSFRQVWNEAVSLAGLK